MSKTFLPTVARATLHDPDTDIVIGEGYLLSESGLAISMDNTEVRGDRNNALQYLYYHTRAVEITLTNVQFEQTFLATNLGQTVVNAAQDVFKTECVTLSNDDGTATETPVGDISVVRANGTILSVTPTGSDFTVSGAGNEKVSITYRRNVTTDRVTISATEVPSVVTLVLMQEVRDNDGNVTDELVVEIPSYQTSGNYTLEMTATGVSTTQLTGMALAVENTSCGDDVYGYVDWVPVTGTSEAVSQIAASPASITAAADTTHQLTVTGIRGGLSGTVNLTGDSGTTYQMRAGSDSDITVSGAGLVTIDSAATSADEGIVDITYTDGVVTVTDSVPVTVS